MWKLQLIMPSNFGFSSSSRHGPVKFFHNNYIQFFSISTKKLRPNFGRLFSKYNQVSVNVDTGFT